MTEEDLRKFDKEALVQFIYADSVFSRERTLAGLRHYENRLRFQKLMTQSEKTSDEMRKCQMPEQYARWNYLAGKYRRIQKETNKILGVR